MQAVAPATPGGGAPAAPVHSCRACTLAFKLAEAKRAAPRKKTKPRKKAHKEKKRTVPHNRNSDDDWDGSDDDDDDWDGSDDYDDEETDEEEDESSSEDSGSDEDFDYETELAERLEAQEEAKRKAEEREKRRLEAPDKPRVVKPRVKRAPEPADPAAPAAPDAPGRQHLHRHSANYETSDRYTAFALVWHRCVVEAREDGHLCALRAYETPYGRIFDADITRFMRGFGYSGAEALPDDADPDAIAKSWSVRAARLREAAERGLLSTRTKHPRLHHNTLCMACGMSNKRCDFEFVIQGQEDTPYDLGNDCLIKVNALGRLFNHVRRGKTGEGAEFETFALLDEINEFVAKIHKKYKSWRSKRGKRGTK